MSKVVEDLLLGTELLHDHTPELDTRYLKLDASNTIFGITDNDATSAQFTKLDTTYTPTGSEAIGTRYWNSTKGTTTLITSANSSLDDGQEVRYYVKANGAISNGDVVQFSVWQGNHYTAKVADTAEVIASPMLLMGIATEDIANGSFGNVTSFGEVTMNTTGWSVNDPLWWDNSTGQLTNVEPVAPERRIMVAAVIKEETSPAAANGIILVRLSWGSKVEELSNVNGTPLTTSGQVMVWDQTNGYFDFTENLPNGYLKLDASNTGDTTITRDANGVITNVDIGSREITLTYTSGFISSYTDGQHTWTITRNANNQVTGVAITEN